MPIIVRTSRRATRHCQTQDTSAYSLTKPTLFNKAIPASSSPPNLQPKPLAASSFNPSSGRQSRSLPRTQRKSSDTKKYPTTLALNSREREGLRITCRVISRGRTWVRIIVVMWGLGMEKGIDIFWIYCWMLVVMGWSMLMDRISY